MAEKANKNATAAERAERNRIFSGHLCTKDGCGNPINRDELRMVRRMDFSGTVKTIVMSPYHVRCYSI
ncbi:MAG: hypothetical protein EPO26_06395 [Chloroflexota bacterium]|nr:MAG: hypothetical protein EPO26_06395 [Chloroflexota bacterium]